jgi:zinc/manganese transport system substrate-binding protein
MRTIASALAFLALLVAPAASQDSPKKTVICTLPVLKVIADELGGGDFDITAISKPDQDPHGVSPTPDLKKKVLRADLFIEIGLQLELWAEDVASGSGNPKVAKGQPGRLVASSGISPEEVPSVLTRAEGDVHPEGNPHLWLDPIRVKTVAKNIAEGLKNLAPDKEKAILERLKKFQDRIDESLFGKELIADIGARTLTRKALDGSLQEYLKEKNKLDKLGGWLRKGVPLKGQKVVEFHKTWIYFARLFGFELVGSVQPKPGISPGPQDLRALSAKMKDLGVKLVIVDNFYPTAEPKSLAEQTGAKVAIVPDQPGGEAGTDDYFKFVDFVLDRMVEAVK